MNRMKQRHEAILRLLQTNSMMKIDELCQILNVSQATIRRDLTELSAHGVERVGGAAFYKKAFNGSPAGSGIRSGLNAGEQIGCIVSVSRKYMHPYFLSILEGIEQGLAQMGHSLAFIHNLDDIQHEADLDRILSRSAVKGLIVVEGVKPEIYEIMKSRVPTIVGIDNIRPYGAGDRL
jgi:DNA-binding LacI/PurR family transcriptional regulator